MSTGARRAKSGIKTTFQMTETFLTVMMMMMIVTKADAYSAAAHAVGAVLSSLLAALWQPASPFLSVSIYYSVVHVLFATTS